LERGAKALEIRFICNDQVVTVDAEPETSLLDILRHNLKLTGTKKGCDQGDCGACSVIMDGKLVNACLVLAGKLPGTKVLTIEGLSTDGELHPIQRAFMETGAIQCGYCTPGMVMATYALLQENKQPSLGAIKTALSGNLCRCTGYSKIIIAIQKAAAYLMKDRKIAEVAEKKGGE
jgi:carbon-monoxide dehydrogenase small subunit